MRRMFSKLSPVLLLAIAAGCGGREPLRGPFGPVAETGDDGGTGSGSSQPTAPPANPVPTPPPVPSDAGPVMPPTPTPVPPPPPMQARDAAVPPPMGGSTCALPRCIAALIAPCTAAGACTTQRTGQGTNVCYANGVKYLPRGGQMGVSGTLVTRPDGTTCYTVETIRRGGGGGAAVMIVVRGPNNEVVAMGAQEQGNRVSLACLGEMPQSVEAACLPAIGGGGGTAPSACVSGACM